MNESKIELGDESNVVGGTNTEVISCASGLNKWNTSKKEEAGRVAGFKASDSGILNAKKIKL